MIGVVGYGCYIPRYRISVEEIAKVWGGDADSVRKGLLVDEKAVAEEDEDTITICVESARNALARANIDAKQIGAVYIGSESHPYSVKPSGTVVAAAIGTTPHVMVADFEFACKAGTAGIQVCHSLVKSGEIDYGLAIGADTAQGKPGDALEYTAASGGAAFIIGKDPLATIDATCSFTTDTPDFWRRPGEKYPRHGGRFTGGPAYFRHVIKATEALLEKTGTRPSDYRYVAFHTPNGKFPLRAAKLLGFVNEQLEFSLCVKNIGNTYSGASMIALANILDNAKTGERILVTSYGSGAGSDSLAMTVTDKIEEGRNAAPTTDYYVNKKENITYGAYVKMRGKLLR